LNRWQEKAAVFFVALSQVHRYKPTFEPTPSEKSEERNPKSETKLRFGDVLGWFAKAAVSNFDIRISSFRGCGMGS
jgi:hypothetical protein